MLSESLSLCVLVVEDELLIRWSVVETLGRAGHRVLEASDAAAARRQAAAGADAIDVILLDLRLPDSSDLQLLRDLRRSLPTSAVILVTAYTTPELADEALALGADRVLTKPLDMRDLPKLVLGAHARRAR